LYLEFSQTKTLDPVYHKHHQEDYPFNTNLTDGIFKI